MDDRVVALAEIALALARASAEESPEFVQAVGTLLRESLQDLADQPVAFEAVIQWVARFEDVAIANVATTPR